MSPADLVVHELLPLGEPDAVHPPRQRTCTECGAELFQRDHDPRCVERARVYRLDATRDPRARHLEDVLERCNRAAFAAHLRGLAP